MDPPDHIPKCTALRCSTFRSISLGTMFLVFWAPRTGSAKVPKTLRSAWPITSHRQTHAQPLPPHTSPDPRLLHRRTTSPSPLSVHLSARQAAKARPSPPSKQHPPCSAPKATFPIVPRSGRRPSPDSTALGLRTLCS